MKRLIVQMFEWYLRPEDHLWQKIVKDAPFLKELGVSDVWMPPSYKGKYGKEDAGYGVYDLYDMGEFNAKGSHATKYGSEAEYARAISTLNDNGINPMADIVLNHRLGADETETLEVIEVNRNKRHYKLQTRFIDAWTKFTFAARDKQYSDFKWNHSHFSGVDFDQKSGAKGVFLFKGKEWSKNVDLELENYDYLMGADVDFNNPDVISELIRWGHWYLDKYEIKSMRLDAVKHIQFDFFALWLKEMRAKRDLFVVGEYWSSDLKALNNYLMESDYAMSLFDVPLHFNLYDASVMGANYDLREIFKNTLVQNMSRHAVTFVDNHDTQVGQSLESYIKPWFRESANAIILLRHFGVPCVFYSDLKEKNIQTMMRLRSHLSEDLYDRFDDSHCVGWSYISKYGLCVLINNGPTALKKMFVGKHHANKYYRDSLGNCDEVVLINDLGIGMFKVMGESVSVYTLEGAIYENISR